MRNDVRLLRSLVPDHDWGWQRRVAAILGVSDTTVSDIIKGRRKMSADLRERAETEYLLQQTKDLKR